MNIFRSKKHKILINLVTSILMTAILCQNIVWANEGLYRDCLAAESRLTPFFERHGLGVSNISMIVMAISKLKKVIYREVQGDVDREIKDLNGFLLDSKIKIEGTSEYVFKCSKRKIRYAVFNFEENGMLINVLFIKEHQKLSPPELKELGINDEEKHHLDCPGLENVWLVNAEKMNVELEDTDQRPLPAETIRLYHCTYLSKIPLILRYGFYHTIGVPAFTEDLDSNINHQFGHGMVILVFDVPSKLIDKTGPSLSRDAQVEALPEGIKKDRTSSDRLITAEARGSLGRLDASLINFQETLTVNRKLVKMFNWYKDGEAPITAEKFKKFKEIVKAINAVATRLDLARGRVFEFSVNLDLEDNADSGDHVSVDVNLGSILKPEDQLVFTIAHELAHLLLLHKTFPSHFYMRYRPDFETYFRERELAADKLAIMMLMALSDHSITAEGIIHGFEEYLQNHSREHYDSFTHPNTPTRIAAIRDLAVQLKDLPTASLLIKAEEFINKNAFININVVLLSLRESPKFISRLEVVLIFIRKILRYIFAGINFFNIAKVNNRRVSPAVKIQIPQEIFGHMENREDSAHLKPGLQSPASASNSQVLPTADTVATLPLTTDTISFFKLIQGTPLGSERNLIIAKAVDSLKIKPNKKVLFIGAGKMAVEPFACSVLGADVTVVQPNLDGNFEQNRELEENFEALKALIKKEVPDFDVSRLKYRLIPASLESSDLDEEDFEYIFLLNVLDSPTNFLSIIEWVLQHLFLSGKIILSCATKSPEGFIKIVSEQASQKDFDIRELNRFFIPDRANEIIILELLKGGRGLTSLKQGEGEAPKAPGSIVAENGSNPFTPDPDIPKGAPATLLKYMYGYRNGKPNQAPSIDKNNPKKSKEMAKERGGKDSLRTIQRELKVLKAVGIVKGSPKIGYYLPDWLKDINFEHIIKDNFELKNPDPTETEIEEVSLRIKETKWKLYLDKEGLSKYPALSNLFSDEIKQVLLEDPALHPVFLIIFPQEYLGPLKLNNAKSVTEIGGEEILSSHSVFLAGTPEVANKQLAKGMNIIVGVTDRYSKKTLDYTVANGRQCYFPLLDGSWLGIKGAGQFAEEAKPPHFISQMGVHIGIAKESAALYAVEGTTAFSGTGGRFVDFLGYRRIYALPDEYGNLVKVTSTDNNPVLIFNRVLSPHRLSKLPQILSIDPELKNICRRISLVLSNLGYLSKGMVLSPHELILMIAKEIGHSEAIKQNKGYFKGTKPQDITFAGEEADNEELTPRMAYIKKLEEAFRPYDYYPEDRELLSNYGIGIFGIVTKVVTLVKVSQCTENDSNRFPSVLTALRVFFASYFKYLDDNYLNYWTEELQKQRRHPIKLVSEKLKSDYASEISLNESKFLKIVLGVIKKEKQKRILLRKQKEVTEVFTEKARIDKTKGKNIILAWDNDLGVEKNYKQLLTELELRFSEGNVRFVRQKGEELQREIVKAKEELGDNNTDIILIAKNTNLSKFGNIDRNYTVAIDDKCVKAGSYLPILEILTFALTIAYETNDKDEISRLYKEITGIELTQEQHRDIISAKSILLTLPPVIPINIDQLSEVYKLSTTLLIAA